MHVRHPISKFHGAQILLVAYTMLPEPIFAPNNFNIQILHLLKTGRLNGRKNMTQHTFQNNLLVCC